MIRSYFVLVILSLPLAQPAMAGLDKEEQSLRFPLPTGIDLGIFELTPFCKLPTVFAKLGYQIIPYHLPNPRIIVEAHKGNTPIAIIHTDVNDKELPNKDLFNQLELVKPPLIETRVTVYGKANSGKSVSSYQDLFNYRTGTVRSLYEISSEHHQLHYFNSMEAAYKALLSDRIDWVIDSDLGLSLMEEKFPKGSIVKSLILDKIYLHLTFSHHYFGKEKAKTLARNYQRDMEGLTKTLGNNCPNTGKVKTISEKSEN